LANEKFSEAQKIKNGIDGPARNIMKFIEMKKDPETNTIDAPTDW